MLLIGRIWCCQSGGSGAVNREGLVLLIGRIGCCHNEEGVVLLYNEDVIGIQNKHTDVNEKVVFRS